MISYPFEVNRIATRVLASGNAGMPMVFVHGAGGRADRWGRNLDSLAAAGYRTYAFDLPGHGFAAKGAGVECSVPAYRRMLAGFMDAIGAEQAVMVGTSLGGHVVASYAAQNPQRAKALVLVGSMGLVAIGAEARSRVQAATNDQTREGVLSKLRRILLDPSLVTADLIEEDFHINNSPGAKASFAALGRYIAEKLDDELVGEKLAATKLPVLLVWGEQDSSVAVSVGEAAAKLIPGAKLVILRGAAHAPYYEKPEAFNHALADFCRTLLGRPGNL